MILKNTNEYAYYFSTQNVYFIARAVFFYYSRPPLVFSIPGNVQTPFSITVATNPWGGSAVGTIRDVVFRHVTFTGSGKSNSVLKGHGPAAGPGGISNFSFVGLSIGGDKVASAAEGHFDIDASTVANVSFA